MDNMTTYLITAIVVSAVAAIIGTFLNSWFVKRRKKHAGEADLPGKHKAEIVPKEAEEPITSELPEIPGKYSQLRVIKGGPPQVWTLEQPQIKIGRSTNVDIYLDSPTVSRNHALLERKNGKFFISDRSSRNGTVVNGKKIEQALELHDGDYVEIGQLKLLFSVVEVDKSG